MKILNQIIAALSLQQPLYAQIELRPVSESAKEGYKDMGLSYSKRWAGEVLIKLPKPTALEVEKRLFFSISMSRESYFTQMPHDCLVIPVPQQELELIAGKMPEDKTSQLAVYVDGTFIGFTPRTKNWARRGVTVTRDWELQEADLDKIRQIGIEVKGTLGFEFGLNKPIAPDKDLYKNSGAGAVEDLVLKKILENPLKSEVTAPEKVVFQQEPAKIAVKYTNVGVDQSAFAVKIWNVDKFRSHHRLAKDSILGLSKAGKPGILSEEHYELLEGQSFSATVNLTRELGLDYQRLGAGKMGLQIKLGIGAVGSNNWEKHNSDAWMDLPAPEVKVAGFAEASFKELQRAVIDDGELLRVGTHKLEKEDVTLLVFTKDGKVNRILRLDLPAGLTTMEMKWDTKKKQAHILATGPKSRYWVTAEDRLDFEILQEVPSSSKLELKDGGVKRRD